MQNDFLDSNVLEKFLDSLKEISEAEMSDVSFVEKFIIVKAGLNNEILTEQPTELAPYFGTGLHIWQYPNQFARYLVWLSKNARNIKRYVEIGSRWGGTFIFVTEWLKRVNPRLERAIAIDPIALPPLIEAYQEISNGGYTKIDYVQALSTSYEVHDLFSRVKPDMVFIDGDHSMRGAFADHMLARASAKIIVHHDVCSDACPETTELWRGLRNLEKKKFKSWEFIDQYDSVNGKYLGIGCLKRRENIATRYRQFISNIQKS